MYCVLAFRRVAQFWPASIRLNVSVARPTNGKGNMLTAICFAAFSAVLRNIVTD